MGIFQYLSEEDKFKIDEYREFYATANSDDSEFKRVRTSEPKSPLSHVLRVWSESKEELYHLFGDKFIVEYEVDIDKTQREMQNQLREMIGYGNNVLKIRNEETITKAKKFFEAIVFAIRHDESYGDSVVGRVFLDYRLIAKNELDTNVTFHDMKFQAGTKITKIFEKIAKYYGIEGFEDFRLVHSLALNNKKTKGKLCLSIHPLDYMTMSDNSSSWSSCMSWYEDGCYRQGTVEMMNSLYTVVAYLKDIDDDNSDNLNGIGWNNKRWRQLFVVAPEIITGVKQYPNANAQLSKFCLDALKNMFPYGQYCDETVEMYATGVRLNYDCTYAGVRYLYNSITFSMTTEYMYSDFGSISDLPVYLGKLPYTADHIYKIPYSGESECMWCGSTSVSHLDNDTLLCSNCYEEDDSDYCWCDNCGDRVYYDDTYSLDGETYCEYCFNEYAVEAINDDWDSHHKSNCATLIFIDEDGVQHCVEDECGRLAYVYVRGNYRRLIDFLSEIGEFAISYGGREETISRFNLADNYIFIKDSEKVREFIENYSLNIGEERSIFSSKYMKWFTAEQVVN